MSTLGHLYRRFRGALSNEPPPAADDAWAVARLTADQTELWRKMQHQDRRHAVDVTRRFLAIVPDAPPAAVAAALMHDVGKIDSRLGTAARVAATITGPRTERFRRYHDHERIGADLLQAAGSAPLTISLVAGTCPDRLLADALRRADDI